ncbi:MAG: hypothetical protein D6691_09810 [Candidatus Hydrogenedentota bacterium]|nr:MAG: hypothetical protein D6691_09810 [Candidatus Hydrogenedentota bacterium]
MLCRLSYWGANFFRETCHSGLARHHAPRVARARAACGIARGNSTLPSTTPLLRLEKLIGVTPHRKSAARGLYFAHATVIHPHNAIACGGAATNRHLAAPASLSEGCEGKLSAWARRMKSTGAIGARRKPFAHLDLSGGRGGNHPPQGKPLARVDFSC